MSAASWASAPSAPGSAALPWPAAAAAPLEPPWDSAGAFEPADLQAEGTAARSVKRRRNLGCMVASNLVRKPRLAERPCRDLGFGSPRSKSSSQPVDGDQRGANAREGRTLPGSTVLGSQGASSARLDRSRAGSGKGGQEGGQNRRDVSVERGAGAGLRGTAERVRGTARACAPAQNGRGAYRGLT